MASCGAPGTPPPVDADDSRPRLELLAGSIGGPGSADGAGHAARFDLPTGLAVDSAGTIYVADQRNHALRKISADGVVTTLAGAPGLPGSADGAGAAARFQLPTGVAIDRAGNLYVADRANHTLRKVTAAGVVTTLAGTAGMPGATDDMGAAARFNFPTGVAVDGAGNVYVADSGNSVVRKVTPAGAVTTLQAATVSFAAGIVVDGAGNVYVSQGSPNACTILKIAATGGVTTLAGDISRCGAGDDTGTAARFSVLMGLAIDAAGNLYVADQGNHSIRKVTAAGVVTTLAGTARVFGRADGAGAAARFRFPAGVALDGAGNVYVADQANHTIRKLTPAGVVTTLAGSASVAGSVDGTTTAARFSAPASAAVDSSGNVYVADRYNHTIRKVTAAGIVTTLAGSAGMPGGTDGTGSAARFDTPAGVAVDSAGNLYVADQGNSILRRIRPDGTVTTLAGTARMRGSVDGTGSAARFQFPAGVAVDSAANIYVADQGNSTVRKVTADGTVTTLAGTAGMVGSDDGTGAAARFHHPAGVAVDSAGNLYIADRNTVRKVTAAGIVTTLAGTAGTAGSADGTGAVARFGLPAAIAVDGAGNVYIADRFNSAIRKIATDGTTTTIAGTPGQAGIVLGTTPRLAFPQGLAIADDAIVICDGNALLALRRAAR